MRFMLDRMFRSAADCLTVVEALVDEEPSPLAPDQKKWHDVMHWTPNCAEILTLAAALGWPRFVVTEVDPPIMIGGGEVGHTSHGT
jgi:hypothetical protein